MSKIKITLLDNQKIKWVGITNFSELYTSMKNWLEDMGYADEKKLEQKYIERIKPEGKKQLEIEWHGEKKKSEFFMYNIDTTILILNMYDVEVQEEGVKVKKQNGFFEIRVTAFIESTKKWDELKGLQKLYEELFIRKRMDVYKEELYKKATSYHSYIKNFLGLRD